MQKLITIIILLINNTITYELPIKLGSLQKGANGVPIEITMKISFEQKNLELSKKYDEKDCTSGKINADSIKYDANLNLEIATTLNLECKYTKKIKGLNHTYSVKKKKQLTTVFNFKQLVNLLTKSYSKKFIGTENMKYSKIEEISKEDFLIFANELKKKISGLGKHKYSYQKDYSAESEEREEDLWPAFKCSDIIINEQNEENFIETNNEKLNEKINQVNNFSEEEEINPYNYQPEGYNLLDGSDQYYIYNQEENQYYYYNPNDGKYYIYNQEENQYYYYNQEDSKYYVYNYQPNGVNQEGHQFIRI